MIQRIICNDCSDKWQLHPEDQEEGWQMRKVPIVAKKPAVHEIRIETAGSTDVIDVPILVCDNCNEELPDGTKCVAMTMWRGSQEPGSWEQGYSQ